MEKMKGERGRIEDGDEGNLSEGEGKEEYERIEVEREDKWRKKKRNDEEIIEGEERKEIWNERRKIVNRKKKENIEGEHQREKCKFKTN